MDEDNFIHVFNRRAYTLLFDSLEQMGATDRMREAKGREMQRKADPTWAMLERAAADLTWVLNPHEAGKSLEEMGDLLMGRVSGWVVGKEPWSDLGIMASTVAESKETKVHVLSVTSNGVNVRIHGYGKGKEGTPPVGLVGWKGELWRCGIGLRQPAAKATDLPSFLDGREAYKGGFFHSMGVILQGEPGMADGGGASTTRGESWVRKCRTLR